MRPCSLQLTRIFGVKPSGKLLTELSASQTPPHLVLKICVRCSVPACSDVRKWSALDNFNTSRASRLAAPEDGHTPVQFFKAPGWKLFYGAVPSTRREHRARSSRRSSELSGTGANSRRAEIVAAS